MKKTDPRILIKDVVALLKTDIKEQGEMAWALRNKDTAAHHLHLGHENEAITVLDFIEKHPAYPALQKLVEAD